MKAQACVRSVEQRGAPMQQLCEHVKRVWICLQRKKNLWVQQKDNKPIPWKGRVICSHHSKLFNFPCPTSVLGTVQLLQKPKKNSAADVQLSSYPHLCCLYCLLAPVTRQYVDLHIMPQFIILTQKWHVPTQTSETNKINTAETDGNTHICASPPPPAPSSSSSKAPNTSRILWGKPNIHYWCRSEDFTLLWVLW